MINGITVEGDPINGHEKNAFGLKFDAIYSISII